jgi:hypothetical protein
VRKPVPPFLEHLPGDTTSIESDDVESQVILRNNYGSDKRFELIICERIGFDLELSMRSNHRFLPLEVPPEELNEGAAAD